MQKGGLHCRHCLELKVIFYLIVRINYKISIEIKSLSTFKIVFKFLNQWFNLPTLMHVAFSTILILSKAKILRSLMNKQIDTLYMLYLIYILNMCKFKEKHC